MPSRARIYVAGPYTKGDIAVNVRNAIAMGEQLAERGFSPYVPHLTHFWHLIFPHHVTYWYALDAEWIPKCDGLLRIPGESIGADREVAMARELGIPVFESLREIEDHFA